MKAASLNYRDLVVPMRGYGSHTGTLPLIPHVGRRRARWWRRGAGVTRVKAGDRVCPLFAQAWISGEPTAGSGLSRTLGGPVDGTMAEYMLLPEDGVAKVPDAPVLDEQAASLPCAALTAWSALVTHDRLGPGARVLVQGTGGVALFALQFAKLLGCARDRDLLKRREDRPGEGASARMPAINYREDAGMVPGDARNHRRYQGYDHILELGGEKNAAAIAALHPGRAARCR